MDSAIAYLLTSILASGVLTGYYWLFLRNRKFHTYNRVYLLATIIVSLLVPFLHLNWFTISLPAVAGTPGLLQIEQGTPLLLTLVKIIVIVVSTALFTAFLIRIAWLYQVKRKHPHTRMNGSHFIETHLRQAPFTFLNNLYWRSDISTDDENGQTILRHELTHIRQKHSYDKLFTQLVLCFCWMNPFYWIIRNELTMVHEFMADAGAIDEGNVQSFAGMLLQSHNEGKYLDPAHSLSHSPVKRRLTMITDCRQASFARWKKFGALPVLAIAIFLLSFTIHDTQKTDQATRERIAKLTAEKAALATGIGNMKK